VLESNRHAIAAGIAVQAKQGIQAIDSHGKREQQATMPASLMPERIQKNSRNPKIGATRSDDVLRK
jgi:hypothetical protein